MLNHYDNGVDCGSMMDDISTNSTSMVVTSPGQIKAF